MITRGEVKGHIEGFSKRAEEAGCELQSSVRGDMLGNAMLGEYMCDKEDSQILRGTIEVHRYGVPWAFGNRKLFQETIGFVRLGFSTHTSGTGFAIVPDIFS